MCVQSLYDRAQLVLLSAFWIIASTKSGRNEALVLVCVLSSNFERTLCTNVINFLFVISSRPHAPMRQGEANVFYALEPKVPTYAGSFFIFNVFSLMPSWRSLAVTCYANAQTAGYVSFMGHRSNRWLVACRLQRLWSFAHTIMSLYSCHGATLPPSPAPDQSESG